MKNKVNFSQITDYIETHKKSILAILLIVHLLLNLILVFTTNITAETGISESSASYSFFHNIILNGKELPLIIGGYRTTLPYIAVILYKIFGSLQAFFIFQAILSTLTIFVLYDFILSITKNYVSAIFALFLSAIYTDFLLLTPVFYNQVIEIFCTVLIINLTQKMVIKEKFFGFWYLIPFIIYLSCLFRSTLRYYGYLLLILGVILLLLKCNKSALKTLLCGTITFILFAIIPLTNFSDQKNIAPNDFIFFGHTLYGGDGGEGSFVYKENEELYYQNLRIYLNNKYNPNKSNYLFNQIKYHQGDSLALVERNQFQSNEIKVFIRNHPFQWLKLQIRKIVWEFGIIPIRDNLTILMTSDFSFNWIGASLISQIPFVLIILIFYIMVILAFNIKDFCDINFILLFLILGYLIAATTLYGHYSERYRIPVVIAAIIPISSFYLNKIIHKSEKILSKSRVILVIVVILVQVLVWFYQVNHIMTHKERYFGAIEKYE